MSRPGRLSLLFIRLLSVMPTELDVREFNWRVSARNQPGLVSSRRTTMVVSRVRLVAGIFSVLTPLWIVADVAAFPREVWLPLMFARLAAALGFFGVLVTPRRMENPEDGYRAVGTLLAIPTLFFVFTYLHLSRFDLRGVQGAFATGYAFLPFVMIAGLSVFPLTLRETLAFSLPVLLTQVVAMALDLPLLNWPTAAASLWLLLLITGVSALSGVSQLAFIIMLVRETVRDRLTYCYARRSGEELLEIQFRNAIRGNTPLTLVFLDLDHFKEVNDRFGHDAGDRVLKDAANMIRNYLRGSDFLVRWGGEEFLLVMPNTAADQAAIALARLRQAGFARQPDDTPVTASIGIAERQRDRATNWQALVAVADARMYEAKRAGRNRMVGWSPEINP